MIDPAPRTGHLFHTQSGEQTMNETPLTRSITYRPPGSDRTYQITGIPDHIPSNIIWPLIHSTTFAIPAGGRDTIDYYEIGIGKVISS
jgi:hypothetical protein